MADKFTEDEMETALRESLGRITDSETGKALREMEEAGTVTSSPSHGSRDRKSETGRVSMAPESRKREWKSPSPEIAALFDEYRHGDMISITWTNNNNGPHTKVGPWHGYDEDGNPSILNVKMGIPFTFHRSLHFVEVRKVDEG